MKTIKIFSVILVLFPVLVFGQTNKNQTTHRAVEKECIALTLPKQDLSNAEKEMLIKMREEEKLAHDVYAFLYDKWGVPIFNNIAKSEANHTLRVKQLLEKYDLEDPSTSVAGKFKNKEIQKLYDDLTAQGAKSLQDALIVGATIEDLDIYDLEEALKNTDNDDIKIVFTNLKRASENHMRAFSRQLKNLYEYDYKPQYISQQEYDKIMSATRNKGKHRR